MKLKLISLTVLVLIVSVIQSACTSSRVTYVAPSGAVAHVNSAIRNAFRGEEQITVSILKEERGCGLLDWRPLEGQRTLFIINRSQSFPEGSISIEANRPVRLRYFQEGRGVGACEVLVEVTFDAGKEYTFFGGHLTPETPNSARRCMFGIKDQSSNLSVKVEQLTRESLCANVPKV
jgi:hypothetical protein